MEQPIDLLDASAALSIADATTDPQEASVMVLNALSLLHEALADKCGIDGDTAAEDPAFVAYYNRFQQYVRCAYGLPFDDENTQPLDR